VVFPETEAGHLDWSLSWYRTANTEENKRNYLSHLQVLPELMNELGVPVIQPRRRYKRARNDPHPNEEGNKAMAEDIRDFLLNTHLTEIQKR
jgi:lysophospholipase L1-like esterase